MSRDEYGQPTQELDEPLVMELVSFARSGIRGVGGTDCYIGLFCVGFSDCMCVREDMSPCRMAALTTQAKLQSGQIASPAPLNRHIAPQIAHCGCFI